jgi:hydroxymethylbilane synthase
LARAQTGWVRARLAAETGLDATEVLVTSEGDVSQAALTSFGGQGVFVTAVREAVVAGRADVAVHSMKDMPTTTDPRTVIAAVPTREDPSDFVVSAVQRLEDLPERARVGTGSPRRVAYLKRARPDLEVVGIRGNVDSRVAKVVSGELDAVVVASAGLHRLGLTPPGFALAPSVMLPAVGQGALSVEMRAQDPMLDAVAALDDPLARAEVVAERSLLGGLRAGCAAPVGARALAQGDELELRAAVLATDGSHVYECVISGRLHDAYDIGVNAANELIGQGAGRLLGENR